MYKAEENYRMRMDMRFFLLTTVAISFASCSKNNGEATRFYEDGRSKPIIAITSMTDSTSFEAPWSLSEELTSLLSNRIAETGSIFVVRKDGASYTENPFDADLTWMKREFPDHEFLVFLELVEHATVPESKGAAEVPFETSMRLKMGVRVRVIDLRSPMPRIVLQELVRDSYFIPKTDIPVDYSVITWKSDDYAKTPMGIAHARLVEEIACRVSDYVHLAKSR
jgi:hypothetical protein